jgi:hypothetical protein
MPANLKQFQLEMLKDLAMIPQGKVAMYTEACVWCMDHNGHHNGVSLEVLFEKKKNIHQILWEDRDIDIQRIRNHYNGDDAVPAGAEAIAIFVCLNNTNYDDLKRSIKKTGIDYWLGYKNENPNLPFHNSGRLEISGILKESESNTVEKRIREKINQTAQSNATTLPVYVVVVAFDRPYAKMVAKNVNS